MPHLPGEKVTSETLDKLRVLLVSDNLAMRTLTVTILRMLGIREVRTDTGSDKTVDRMRQYRPDLIVVDCDTNPMAGPTLVGDMRRTEDGAFADIPVVMISAYAERQLVERARDAGVNDFLVKPFAPRTLLQHVKYTLEHRRPTVRSKGYFGPDRRQKPLTEYRGPERRGTKSGRTGTTDTTESETVETKTAAQEKTAKEEGVAPQEISVEATSPRRESVR